MPTRLADGLGLEVSYAEFRNAPASRSLADTPLLRSHNGAPLVPPRFPHQRASESLGRQIVNIRILACSADLSKILLAGWQDAGGQDMLRSQGCDRLGRI